MLSHPEDVPKRASIHGSGLIRASVLLQSRLGDVVSFVLDVFPNISYRCCLFLKMCLFIFQAMLMALGSFGCRCLSSHAWAMLSLRVGCASQHRRSISSHPEDVAEIVSTYGSRLIRASMSLYVTLGRCCPFVLDVLPSFGASCCSIL